jgi:hypothetical protein
MSINVFTIYSFQTKMFHDSGSHYSQWDTHLAQHVNQLDNKTINLNNASIFQDVSPKVCTFIYYK